MTDTTRIQVVLTYGRINESKDETVLDLFDRPERHEIDEKVQEVHSSTQEIAELVRQMKALDQPSRKIYYSGA